MEEPGLSECSSVTLESMEADDGWRATATWGETSPASQTAAFMEPDLDLRPGLTTRGWACLTCPYEVGAESLAGPGQTVEATVEGTWVDMLVE